MEKIHFKHCGSGNEYWLEGDTVCWKNENGYFRTNSYSREQIVLNFKRGVWAIIEKPVSEINATDNKDNQESLTTVAAGQGGVERRAIKSDGGSSTYYDIGLPQWLVTRILERQEAGNAFIKTEELIEVGFTDDFDAGNAFKSLVRLWGAFNGGGKVGNSVSYEKKKIEYSVNKLEQRFQRVKEEA